MNVFLSSNKKRRTLLAAELILLCVGFVFLGWAGYRTGQRILDNSWEDYRFEQALEGQKPTLVGYVKYLRERGRVQTRGEDEQPAPASPPDVQSKSVRPKKLSPNDLIGRIEIPRVQVSAIVKEGVDSKTLSRAVGHVPHTALPGQKGNVGVAAHRDTHFRGLRNIRKGDSIRLVTVDGVYLYQVDSLKIVYPKNVEVLDPTPDPRITLVTCYPFNYVGSAPKRFIVQAKQVGFEELSARSKTPAARAGS